MVRWAARCRRVRYLLNRPVVQKGISEAQQGMLQELMPGSIDALLREVAVLRELKAIAFSDITDLAIDPATGKVYSRSGDPNATRAVMRVKRTRQKRVVTDEEGEPTVEAAEEVTVTLWDKVEALGLLMKHLGLMGSQVK